MLYLCVCAHSLLDHGFCGLLACSSLQLALVLLVPVGSLLPYGSHPLRWGHPCGVEARLSSIGTKVSCVFSFPFGLFLHVVTALRDMVTIWVRCVGRFTLLRDQRLSLVLRPFSFWLGFEPLSEASLSALSLQVCLLVVLAEDESLRLSLALSSVLPCPMFWFHVTSMSLAPGLRLSLVPHHGSFRMGLAPLSEAPFSALQPPAHSFLVVLAEATCLRKFFGSLHCSFRTVVALPRPPALPFLLSAG